MFNPIEKTELLMLQKMYLDLKIMASQLLEFEEKHELAKAMKESLDECINSLDSIAHELCFDACKIKKENFENGETQTRTDNCSM